ncbi:MAG: right-handed parallel beta-helix repeat-containing protein [Sedimentisphaerales bacterium]|nr:right-handed parallel beta-helix repeat-containing protein [Sedimentisphaerales bacterium]
MIRRTCIFGVFLTSIILSEAVVRAMEIRVADSQELMDAAREAVAGTTLLLEPGQYSGGLYLCDLAGMEENPIVIAGADPNDPPVFRGGGQALHLADCRCLTLKSLRVEGFPANGINIDDGGSYETPAHGIVLEDVTILGTGPEGNHDALKMSGVDRFAVRRCHFEGWGGSGIDMVGCHDGVVEDCTFVGREGYSQSNGVQLKGGTANVLVHRCRFQDAGHRSINLGGSTGLQFFRPGVGDYEAKGITIAGNRFTGSSAAVAWVTADGGHVHHNTMVLPEKWILRILQETEDPQFRPSHGGVFEENLIVYDSRVQVFVNVGPRTAPETFTFRRNVWLDAEGCRRPSLPVAEQDGAYLCDVGAEAYKPSQTVSF